MVFRIFGKLKTFRDLINNAAQQIDILGLNFQNPSFNTKRYRGKLMLWLAPIIVLVFLNVRTYMTVKLELNHFIANLCFFLASFMAIHRTFQIIVYEEELNKLVNYLNECTDNVLPANNVEVKLLRKYLSFSKRMTQTLTFIYKLTGYSATLFPFFFSDMYQLINISIPYLDTRSHPGYEILLLINIYISYYCLRSVDSFDRYFYFFTFFIAMRSEVCSLLASKIGDYDSEYCTASKQRQLLQKIVLLHQNIQRFTVTFSTTYSILILCQGISSLFYLTLGMFLINSVMNPAFTVAIVCISTTQFLLLCFFGELIFEHSSNISQSIYTSKWYYLSDTKDRLVIAFLINTTQRKIKFSAYGMYDLSLETFSRFLMKAYGFFAFLREVI